MTIHKNNDSATIRLGVVEIQLRWASATSGNYPYWNMGLYQIKKTSHFALREIFCIWKDPQEDNRWHFQSMFLRRMRNRVNRLIHFAEIANTKKEIHKLRVRSNDIWGDPMCGCPEDFAEAWSRKAVQMEQKLYNTYYR